MDCEQLPDYCYLLFKLRLLQISILAVTVIRLTMLKIKDNKMKIKLHVSTGLVNGDHVDYACLPENWNDFTEGEKEKFINDCAIEFLHECCKCSGYLVEEIVFATDTGDDLINAIAEALNNGSSE